MDDYRSNSHKSKEEKKLNKVVAGRVKTKKKNEIQKLADVFISEDVANVKDYIFMDVLIPAMKKAISDVVTNGIDMILYGESGHSKKSSSGSRVPYRNYYNREKERHHTRTRMGYDFEDIILDGP